MNTLTISNRFVQAFLLIFFIGTLTTSCNYQYYGNITGNASLSDTNFTIVNLAIGQSYSWRVFGIGGYKKQALVMEAKKDLYARTQLKSGQALANVTVDFKHSYYLVCSKILVTVSADVVDFHPNAEPISAKTKSSTLIETPYKNGDSVYVYSNYNYTLGEIIETHTNKALVKYEVRPDKFKTKKISEDKIIYNDNRLSDTVNYDIQIGDTIDFMSLGGYEQMERSGEVVGLNPKYIIVEYKFDENNKRERIDYEKVKPKTTSGE